LNSIIKNSALLLILILSLSCKSTPEKYFEKAREFDDSGDFNRAVLYYERISDLYPDSKLAPESLMRAARISRLYLEKTKSALGFLNAIILNYPDSEYVLSAQKEMADIFMDDLKNYTRAISEYSKLIQMNPPKDMLTDARLRIAKCFEYSGNYEQALIELQGLLDAGNEINPEIKEKVEYEINVLLYITKDLVHAIQGFQEFIKKYPESELIPDAKFYLAGAYADSGEFSKALFFLHEIENSYRNPDAVRTKIQGIEIRMKKVKR
jgi:TolA-binding protein